jgi:DNA-binding FadR family transcriptional regulator
MITYNKIKKPNLVKEVYTQLREQIVNGEMKEGDKLPSENKLCSQFDVSRVVIREAMQTLRANNLIVTKQGKGSFIANPENFVLEKYDTSNEKIIGKVTESDILDFFAFREVVELKGLELAAKNLDEEEMKILASKVKKMIENKGNTEQYSIADYEFHLEVMKASKNEFLYASYKACRSLILRCLIKLNSFHDSHQWGIDKHEKICKALMEGNAKEAKNLLVMNNDYNLARLSSIKE